MYTHICFICIYDQAVNNLIVIRIISNYMLYSSAWRTDNIFNFSMFVYFVWFLFQISLIIQYMLLNTIFCNICCLLFDFLSCAMIWEESQCPEYVQAYISMCRRIPNIISCNSFINFTILFIECLVCVMLYVYVSVFRKH